MSEYLQSQASESCQQCPRAVYAKGLCESHYKKDLRERNPAYDTSQREALRVNKLLVRPDYKSAHRNVYKERGAAKDYDCVDCGNQAKEWSLDIDAGLYGIEQKKTFPYSLNVYDYSPRCTRCHGLYDRKVEDL